MTASRRLQKSTYPDCESDGCQFEESDIPCESCPLISPEYENLIQDVSDPLYRAAALYLLDHELGLDRFWDPPTYRLVEAIRFVHGERHRQEDAARKWKEGKR